MANGFEAPQGLRAMPCEGYVWGLGVPGGSWGEVLESIVGWLVFGGSRVGPGGPFLGLFLHLSCIRTVLGAAFGGAGWQFQVGANFEAKKLPTGCLEGGKM